MTAIFKIKHVYGNPLAYPVNEAARAICTLLKTKTWVESDENRTALRTLGVLVEIRD